MTETEYKFESLNAIKPLALHLSQIAELCPNEVNVDDQLSDILGKPVKYVNSWYYYKKNHEDIHNVLLKIYAKEHEGRDKTQITDTKYMLYKYEIDSTSSKNWFVLSWIRVDDSIELTMDNVFDYENNPLEMYDYDISLLVMDN